MKPIPETIEADRQYGPFEYENRDLLDRLVALGHDIQTVAPTCTGMSMTLTDHGVTFTLVATDAEAGLLDAVQYLEDGPCETALDLEEHVAYRSDDPLSEDRWQIFAAASAAHGVASTLSLPVVLDGATVAGFNLYGSAVDTFEGRHEQLANLLGAWAPGAVTNADLSFGTLQLARRAPEVLRDATRLAVAATLLARREHLTLQQAEGRLRGAAVRSAVPLPKLVDSVITILQGNER